MVKYWGRWVALLLFTAFSSSLAEPLMHDLPQDTVMNAFVKVDADRVNLVVRVPLDLLRGISFPTIHGDYAVTQAGPAVEQALDALGRAISLWANDTRLVPSSATGRLTALGDRSFMDYDAQVAQIAAPVDADLKIAYDLGYLDAHFVYPITSPHAVFSIRSRVAEDLQDIAKLIVRYVPLDGGSRTMSISGELGRVALNPTWYHTAVGFVVVGIEHILTNVDCLLFALCLIIPFRRIEELAPLAAAFAVGCSVTLIGAAHGLAPAGNWFPAFIGTAIAVSILLTALENIVGANLRRRWLLAGLYGLLYGFGFAALWGERMQFAGTHTLAALLFFDGGIEIGLLLALCFIVPALALLFRGAMAGRMGVIVLSAILAHAAWHWMIDRCEVLWHTPWPQLTMASFYLLAQWAFALLLAVGAAHLVARWIERKWPGLAARRAD
jgi:hypothetical protein